METSDLTARQIYQGIKDNPSRARFGFGHKAILVNIDLLGSMALRFTAKKCPRLFLKPPCSLSVCGIRWIP